MKVQIFDVEHGGCALLTADTGARILIDCGHNSSSGWRPSTYLQRMGVRHLEKLMITNYDEDHASDLPNLLRVVSIGTLHSNLSVTGKDLRHLKTHGGIGDGIDALADLKSRYTKCVTQPKDFGNLSIKSFWNKYPDDFEDENNLSIVSVVKAHGLTMCFPGDMEVAGWLALLENPDFCSAIGEVNVFVASHHGRQNGCCDELFTETALYPTVTIISDAGVQYASQETVAWYGSRTRGMTLSGNTRRVLTTRHDGRIAIEALPNSITLQVGA